jgi:hypothetical protein
MMTLFPVPYEDELLYSILARYRIYSGNISLKSTLDDIYGYRNVTAVMDLPSHIDRIITNMPIGSKYSAEELVDKYTLYPLYSAFLPPEDAEIIKKYMKADKGGSIYNKIGLMASSISLNQYFKFCPHCIKEDIEKYGELYWHRLHQIPGVLVCHKHIVLLHDSQLPIRGFNKHEYKNASLDICTINNRVLECSDRVLEHLVNLAIDSEALLNKEFPNKPLQWFREQYINRLIDFGYASINGSVRQKNLLTDFVDYYGDNLLTILQSEINIDSEHTWLTEMLRKKSKTTHPIRHLLLMKFLNISIDDLFNNKFEYKPFDKGPWPCLNPASEHFRQMTVKNLKIKYGNDSKSPLGIFECSCGFSYMRTGPDTKGLDKYKITKIIAFGPVWENRLRELSEKKLSLRETARQLQVDPATIKKYTKKLGFQTFWKERSNEVLGCTDTKVNINEIDKRSIYRQKWLDLRKSYPEKSKTELRSMDRALYTWLYRNDREWLNDNSPNLITKTNTNQRVDWKQRDEVIFDKAVEVVNEILKTSRKPKRITIGLIGSMIGERSLLEKHLNKMKKTKEYLEQVTQNISDYQITRIQWAIKELQEDGQELQLWRIYRKAGIRQEYQESLKKYILGMIEK